MSHLNVEIKAKSNNQAVIRTILKAKKAIEKGLDHQIDTLKPLINKKSKKVLK